MKPATRGTKGTTVNESEPPSSERGYPPADFRRRALARSFDLLIAVSPLLLAQRGHPLAGAMLCAAVLLASDSLAGAGRSPGKRLAGLRVVVLATRRPAGTRDSMVRNAVFVLSLLPTAVGAPLQLSVAALGCLALVEAAVALRPLTRDLGQRRIGDLLAGTQVVDASIAIGLTAPGAGQVARAPAPLASRAARQQLRPREKEIAACASP